MPRVSSLTISITRAIVFLTVLHLATGLTLWLLSFLTQEQRWVRYFLDFQGPLFFVGFSALELYFSFVSWSRFTRGEFMRWAWLLIMISSASRFVGLTIVHAFGVSPVLQAGIPRDFPQFFPQAMVLRQLALAICGPIQLSMLALALVIVLRTYRRFGLLSGFRTVDLVMLGSALSFGLYRTVATVMTLIQENGQISSYETTQRMAVPLLCILLCEAVLLGRVALNTGWGLIAKCWGVYGAAILGTALGNLGVWAVSLGYGSGLLLPLVWFLWTMTAAAFTLGPAYQMEGSMRAKEQLKLSFVT